MAVLLSPVGGVAGQFFDNNGNPLTGGKMYSYVAGTTTPQATYTSSAGTVAHSNPIILDAGGRVPGGEIWLTDGLQYKFVLKNANDVLIGTYDNIIGINSNFVNFLTETEVQTATAGQTVFTLATMQYQPGTNNLTVYVDGVNQIDGSTYSYVETSSTVITFTAGLHVGALVKFTTAQTLSTGVTDASLVTYDPPFTNSVTTTVEAKLAQTVSVTDFIPTGTNTATTDCSSFFNAAIIAASGEFPIYVPSGTYLITSPIELNWSSEVGTIYQQATQFIGQSTVDTIILNRSGDYGLKHTVTSAQAQQAGAGKRMTNGVLCNFSITTDGSSPVGSAGIELFSFWFGYIHDINVSSSKEHGIYLPVDVAISANPDNYSCGQLKVERCDIRSSTGWGIKAAMYSITWLLDSNYIVNNALGGVYTAGTGHEIVNNAIAGNGTDSTSVGLHIAYASVGTPHNVYIRDNEMDNNWGTHITLEGYNHIVEQNRFIQDAAQGAGGVDYRNDYCVKIDPTLTGISQCVVNQNTFRFDNPGTATLIGIYIVPVAGATANQCINNVFVSKPATVDAYNFPSSRARNFAVEDGLQMAGSDETQYSYGQMTVVAPLNTAMTTAGAKLSFNATYDPQTRWFASTNQFYVPLYSGILRIDANLLIRHTATANTAVTIQVKKNGSVVQTFSYPSGFAALGIDYSIAFTAVFAISGGDQIEIFGVAATASTTFSISGNQTITFQML